MHLFSSSMLIKTFLDLYYNIDIYTCFFWIQIYNIYCNLSHLYTLKIHNDFIFTHQNKSKTKNIKMVKLEINIPAEQYYVEILEKCCYKLRDAMIDMSLKCPEISTFERYFKELRDFDSVVYIVGLLHRCWCFAHPAYLFDTVPKDLSYEAMINSLNKYQPGSGSYGMDFLKEELNKKINPLITAYYKAYSKAAEMELCYGDYMEELYHPTSLMCSRFNIKLTNTFTIHSTIQTDKTPQQLKDAFTVFSRDFKCCAYTEENSRIFLSIFDTTYSAAEGTIMWTDTGTKSKQASLASIYTVFSTLGVSMNQHTRAIIAKHIVWQNGSITPEQIKARNGNEKQEKLREAILTAITKKKEQQ